MLEYCAACVPPDRVFPLMIFSAIAGALASMAAYRLGVLWKARRG